MSELARFQLKRLAHLARQEAGSPWQQRLLDHALVSLYRSCQAAGAEAEARELLRARVR